MRHVYGIWFVRKVLPGLALELGAFAAFAFFVQWFIKWGHILNNVLYRLSHHPIGRMGDFWLAALFNTEPVTILLVLASIVTAALFARDTIRVARNLFMPYRVSI